MTLLERVIRKIKYLTQTPREKALQSYYSVVGSKTECNICNYKTNQLDSDSWHLYITCPICKSTVRQRLLWASLNQTHKFSEVLNYSSIINNKKILHFAPDKSLTSILKNGASEYKTADFFTEGYSYDHIDYNLDISAMQQTISDSSFDTLIACDVLEHVYDHLEALNEINRVLKKGGYCLLTVPQKDNLEVTFEDFTITDPKEREKVFGQFDHLRIYGHDFVKMMENAGFEVITIDENSFDKKIADKFVLYPPVLSDNPLATNYRKVFFGKKV